MRYLRNLFLLLMLVVIPARSTFTTVQTVENASISTCGTNSGTACTLTVSAIGTNHLLILMIFVNTQGSISAVSGGGGTWQNAGGACIVTATDGEYVDCWYNTSPNTASTSVVATCTIHTCQGAVFYEFSSTGTPTLSAANSSNNGNAASASQVGLAPTLNGLNNLVVQGGYADGSVSINSIDQSYVLQQATGSLSRSTGLLSNTTNNFIPTWTLSASARFTASYIAFYDTPKPTYVSNHALIVVGP